MGWVATLLDNRKAFFWLLAGYFLLQLLVRLSMPDSLELDEAEQIFQSQWWILGYGPQPPLYNWLQQGFLGLFGHHLIALSLLKNLLLLSTWSLIYLVSLRVLGSNRLAALVTLSLVFIPQISWESQRDLSHSVLVTTLAACTLYLGVRLLERPSLGCYLLLGLCVGLGCNAKYSYFLFIAAAAISVLSLRDVRQQLLRPELFLSIVVALAICLPHWWWLASNLQLASESTLGKLIRPGADAFWALRWQGLGSLFTASFQFLALFLLVFLGFFLRHNSRRRPDSVLERLILRYLLVLGGIFLLFILLTGVNFIKDRWMQPLLLVAPLAGFILLRSGSGRGQGGYALTALIFMALIPTLLVLRVVALDVTQRPERLNLPYSELVSQAFPDEKPALVLTERVRTAGNIRFQLPDTDVLTAERMDLGNWNITGQGEIWMIWNATDLNEIPAELADAINRLQPEMRIAGIRYLDIPYHYADDLSVSFGLALLLPDSS